MATPLEQAILNCNQAVNLLPTPSGTHSLDEAVVRGIELSLRIAEVQAQIAVADELSQIRMMLEAKL